MYHKRLVKMIPVKDNWYPNFAGNCVESVLTVVYYDTVKDMEDKGKNSIGYVKWRICGADDFYLEKEYAIQCLDCVYSCYVLDSQDNEEYKYRKVEEYEDITGNLYAIKLIQQYDVWASDLQTVKMNGTADVNYFKKEFNFIAGI